MQALKLNEIFNEHLAFFFVFFKLPYQIYGRTPKQPVSKRPAMKLSETQFDQKHTRKQNSQNS
jgi:hypothetical protein